MKPAEAIWVISNLIQRLLPRALISSLVARRSLKKTRIVVRQDLGLLDLHACFCQVFNKLVRVKSKSTAHQGFLSSYFSFDISIFKMKSKIYLLILVLPGSPAHADIGTDLAEFWQDPGGRPRPPPEHHFRGNVRATSRLAICGRVARHETRLIWFSYK